MTGGGGQCAQGKSPPLFAGEGARANFWILCEQLEQIAVQNARIRELSAESEYHEKYIENLQLEEAQITQRLKALI